MSNDTEHKLNSILSWVTKGIVAMACWFAVQTFNDMKEASQETRLEVKEMRKDFKEVLRDVERHDTELKAHEKEIDRLDRQKVDRR